MSFKRYEGYRERKTKSLKIGDLLALSMRSIDNSLVIYEVVKESNKTVTLSKKGEFTEDNDLKCYKESYNKLSDNETYMYRGMRKLKGKTLYLYTEELANFLSADNVI